MSLLLSIISGNKLTLIFIPESAVDSGDAARKQRGAGVSTNPFLQDSGPGRGRGPGPGSSLAAGAAAPSCLLPANSTPLAGNDMNANANPLLLVNAHASAADGSRHSSGDRLGVHARQQQLLQEEQLLIRMSDERMRSSSASGGCADGRHCLPLERAYSENPSTSRLIVNVPDAVALQIASADPSRGIYTAHLLVYSGTVARMHIYEIFKISNSQKQLVKFILKISK